MNNFSKLLAVYVSLADATKLHIENEMGEYSNGYLTPMKINMAQTEEASNCNSTS
jgi:hypothetical protein